MTCLKIVTTNYANMMHQPCPSKTVAVLSYGTSISSWSLFSINVGSCSVKCMNRILKHELTTYSGVVWQILFNACRNTFFFQLHHSVFYTVPFPGQADWDMNPHILVYQRSLILPWGLYAYILGIPVSTIHQATTKYHNL